MKFEIALPLIAVFMSWSIEAATDSYAVLAPHLIECYNKTEYRQRQTLLPATVPVLVDLIRRIEEANPTLNSRQLSAALLRRYKQDGIVRSKHYEGYGIPYAPSSWDRDKNTILMRHLLPKIELINNTAIDSLEKCSLHSIISSAVSWERRGDERSLCSTLGRYRVRVRRRSSNAELLEPAASIDASPASECPIEEGVIYNRWGSFSGGSLLAGIAAGLNVEQVPVPGHPELQIDNRLAATVLADLGEGATCQGGKPNIGCEGNWNGTLLPHYYFLARNKDLQVTDAELRGDLDGLYLAKYLSNGKIDSFTVSQLVDLYYSERGLDKAQLKACNRSIQVTHYLTTDEATGQLGNYLRLLDFADTYCGRTIRQYSDVANGVVDQFNRYITQLKNTACDDGLLQRTAMDLLIVVDTSWDFTIIKSAIAYILENIDINKYDSSLTILTGHGIILLNKTTSIVQFYKTFNPELYSGNSKSAGGIDFLKALKAIDSEFRSRLDSKSAGGQSTVALIIARTSPSSGDTAALSNLKDAIKSHLPDLKIIVMGSAPRSEYESITTSSDIFTLTNMKNEDSIKTDTLTVLRRIKILPRNMVNPKCTSNFSTDATKSSFEIVQYIEPGALNSYKIAPNYFYTSESGVTLSLYNNGPGTLTVCQSRLDPPVTPTKSTPSESICVKVAATASAKLLSDPGIKCDSLEACLPVYLSVKGPDVGQYGVDSFTCSDALCRFPDNVRFSITLENGVCVGSSTRNMSCTFLITLLIVILFSYKL